MDLIVGCPIKNRAWIVERWVRHIKIAATQANVGRVMLLVIGDTENDKDTFRALDKACFDYGLSRLVGHVNDPEPYKRNWGVAGRLQQMAELRNELLTYVRSNEPRLFWSLDSDILAHPEALAGAVEAMGTHDFDAVGTKCFMSERDDRYPSYGQLGAAGMKRANSMGVFPVDVIMATKVMNPAAYQVDYRFDRLGEDIGWSRNAREAGLRLGWDGRFCSRHVMRPELLDVEDDRC